MTLAERIAEIEAAAQTPGGLTLRSVARMTEGQPDLARALDAAAVPHWWDAARLAQVLDTDLAPQAEDWAKRLRELSVVEPFLSRPGASNVHEVTRQALRARLHEEGKLPELSARVLRALGPVAADAPPAELIERLHHQLLAEPEAGAEALERQWRAWDTHGRWAALNDLAAALEEILPHLAPPARARALLRRADIRKISRPASELASQAEECFRLFSQLGNERGMAQALTGQADALAVQGRPDEARQAHQHALTIRRRLAALDPANVQAQRAISVSLHRLAELDAAAGRTEVARAGFAEGLAIFRRLAALDPANVLAQRDVSLSLARLADLDDAAGRTEAARAGFAEGLGIARRLAALDPANVQTQRDVSVSLERLADLDAAAGRTGDARAGFAEVLAIRRRLAALDPANVQAQRDVSVSLARLAVLDAAAGRTEDARAGFAEWLAIARRLAVLDPANVQAQRDVSLSLERLANLDAAAGRTEATRAGYAEALAIRRRLAALDPANVQAQDDLAISFVQLAMLPDTEPTEALRLLTEAKTIWKRLAALAPQAIRYANFLGMVTQELAARSPGPTSPLDGA
ncbi:MAG: hypothetical protein RL514_3053 [Verrucomicrobiota bacterium]|jgi:tetratricopeptide (TPR) repeat protein